MSDEIHNIIKPGTKGTRLLPDVHQDGIWCDGCGDVYIRSQNQAVRRCSECEDGTPSYSVHYRRPR